MLQGKRILIGVTGGIAAYKVANLVRLLIKGGAEVRVVMTPMSQHFITPLTLATLSQNLVSTDFFDSTSGEWNSHITLGRWADLFLIAPATANTLAKMACGLADNLLTATYLAARCPVIVAPAMDVDMYEHVATQDNLAKLAQRGVMQIDPEEGFLASGLIGKGRMAEVERIYQAVERLFAHAGRLSARKILVTMGPTREPIDPVRYITNHSTGRMGAAIVDALAQAGAEVHCVAGPADVLPLPSPNVQMHKVLTAREMLEECESLWSQMDAGIMTAAVADYTPSAPAESKMKRKETNLTLRLTASADIAKTLGEKKSVGQYLVGFALETENGEENAKKKIESKHLDLCLLNSLQDPGAGFGTPTNRVTFIFSDGRSVKRPLESKTSVARALVEVLANELERK